MSDPQDVCFNGNRQPAAKFVVAWNINSVGNIDVVKLKKKGTNEKNEKKN